MNPTLNLALVILTGLLCLYFAYKLGSRELKNESDRLAWQALRVWWFFLGLSTLVTPVRTLLVNANVQDLNIYLWLGLANTAALCAALWGLLFYLIYLYTGNRKWALPLGVFYLLFFLGLVYYSIFVMQPTGVTMANGTATLTYANQASPLFGIATILLLLAPQILAALFYFSLFFRLKDRAPKMRVLLVSVPLVIWFASPLIGLLLGASTAPWWAITSRLIALAAVVVIYWAYYPPRVLQNWMGVASV